MPNRMGTSEQISMVVASVLVGFLALAFTQSLFMLFFAPIVVYVLWSDSKKMNQLEKRLTELENLSSKKSVTHEGAQEVDPGERIEK